MATLIASSHHSPVEDAEALRNAFKGAYKCFILIDFFFMSFLYFSFCHENPLTKIIVI